MKETTLCITVSDDLQSIILPPYGVTFGVSGDVNVNEIRMKLPKECKGFNLIRFVPRINYVNANGDANYYETVMESDESNCHFIWPITPDITAYTGHVRFSLTLYQTEGDNILHKFNTRSATGRVYTGFEVEKQVTPEQQQTLLSKMETQIKTDLNDHTEKLKSELTKKGQEILDGFGEYGSASEELKTIKQDLGTKLTAPPTPEVGKILKIRSVNEDGTFICEWADDGGSNLDVRINGKSIVQDGVAEIPISSHDTLGLVYTDNSAGGYTTGLMNRQGRLQVNTASIDDVNKRRLRKEIDCSNFDYAVKAAMCDGKGTAWTAEEQAAARERMGIGTSSLVYSYTLIEDVVQFEIPFTEYGDYVVYLYMQNNYTHQAEITSPWGLCMLNAVKKDNPIAVTRGVVFKSSSVPFTWAFNIHVDEHIVVCTNSYSVSWNSYDAYSYSRFNKNTFGNLEKLIFGLSTAGERDVYLAGTIVELYKVV